MPIVQDIIYAMPTLELFVVLMSDYTSNFLTEMHQTLPVQLRLQA